MMCHSPYGTEIYLCKTTCSLLHTCDLECWKNWSVLKHLKKQRPKREKEQQTFRVNRYQSKKINKIHTKPTNQPTKHNQKNPSKTKQKKNPKLFHCISNYIVVLEQWDSYNSRKQLRTTTGLPWRMKDFSLSGTLVVLICDSTHVFSFIKERKSVILIGTIWLYEMCCSDFITIL